MSRRDTIIISVLINAGLLAILFVTAWNADDDQFSDASEVNRVVAEAQKEVRQQPTPSSLVGVDEVDRVLQQHAVTQQVRQEGRMVPSQQPSVTSRVTGMTGSSPCEAGDFVDVTVKRGDYLDKIARANGTSVEAIMRANGLVDTRLQIGQVLRVPKSESTPQPSREVVSVEAAASGFEDYVVKRGENPWIIARNHNVKPEELLRVNNLDDTKARNLRAGDKLKIPSSGGSANRG